MFVYIKFVSGFVLIGQILTARLAGIRGEYTSYSKMAANLLFFYMHVNFPSLSHFLLKILLYFDRLTRQRGLIYMDIKEL